MSRAAEEKKPFKMAVYGLMLSVLFLELFFFAWCRTQCIRTGYLISQAEAETEVLVERRQRLHAQLAHLHSPRRIMKIGEKKLGLTMPKPEQVVMVMDY